MAYPTAESMRLAIEKYGKWLPNGSPYHRDPEGIATKLPEGAEGFKFLKREDLFHAIGKWVHLVTNPRDPGRWERITDIHYDPDRKLYRAITLNAVLHMSHYWRAYSYFHRPYNKAKLRDMRKIAYRYARHEDLAAAIIDVWPNYSARSQSIRYHVLANSPTFHNMLKQELRKALKDQGIDSNFLIRARKELIEGASQKGDFSAAEKLLKGLEQIFEASYEQSNQIMEGVGLPEGTDIKSLIEAKREALASAQDIDPLNDTIPTTDQDESKSNPEK